MQAGHHPLLEWNEKKRAVDALAARQEALSGEVSAIEADIAGRREELALLNDRASRMRSHASIQLESFERLLKAVAAALEAGQAAAQPPPKQSNGGGEESP